MRAYSAGALAAIHTILAAKLQPVPPALKGEGIATFDHGVPGMHGCCSKGISDSGVSLHRKPRRARRSRSAKSDALNPKLRNDVVHTIVL